MFGTAILLLAIATLIYGTIRRRIATKNGTFKTTYDGASYPGQPFFVIGLIVIVLSVIL